MAFIDKFMNRKFPNKPVIVLDKTGNQIELSNKRKYKVIRNEEEIEIYPESLRKGDKIIEVQFWKFFMKHIIDFITLFLGIVCFFNKEKV